MGSDLGNIIKQLTKTAEMVGVEYNKDINEVLGAIPLSDKKKLEKTINEIKNAEQQHGFDPAFDEAFKVLNRVRDKMKEM